MKKASKKALRIFAIVLVAIYCLLGSALIILCIIDAASPQPARTLPSYAREDISALAAKTEWTEEEYRTLYLQTGLGKSALHALKGDADSILSFQDALFYQGEIKRNGIAITTSFDSMEFTAPMAPLEDGDVIVTSSCHTFGWRNGHAALVITGATGKILESYTLGANSSFSDTLWFCSCSNFMVLRLKDQPILARREIAKWASEHLYDIPYSVMTGLTYSKDQGESPQVTHCSHLVWQAYYQFGYDIDSDGGPVCTTRDIANSPYFEVVQVYGFDPLTLW